MNSNKCDMNSFGFHVMCRNFIWNECESLQILFCIHINFSYIRMKQESMCVHKQLRWMPTWNLYVSSYIQFNSYHGYKAIWISHAYTWLFMYNSINPWELIHFSKWSLIAFFLNENNVLGDLMAILLDVICEISFNSCVSHNSASNSFFFTWKPYSLIWIL